MGSDAMHETVGCRAVIAERFEPLSAEKLQLWSSFGAWEDKTSFSQLVGLTVEELRIDYCRMRMPYRKELNQPAGVVHGGALATLLDTVVVPAVGSYYDERPRSMLTVSMNVQYLGALMEEDGIGEGWVEQRGRSMVFCRAEVTGATSGRMCANATLVYKVST
jgi:uncharacterized protein (TIGR00369 family)